MHHSATCVQIVHETLDGDGESPATVVSYFLDGAHTPESILTCARWFARAAGSDATSSASSLASAPASLPPTQRMLVFNCTKVMTFVLVQLHFLIAGQSCCYTLTDITA